GLLHASINSWANGGSAVSTDSFSVPGNAGFYSALQHITNNRTVAPYNVNDTTDLINFGYNDLGRYGIPGLGATDAAMQTVIARARAGAVFEAENATNISYSGTWTLAALTGFASGPSGGEWKGSSTIGDTFTISVPADFPGGEADVGAIACGNKGVLNFT